MARFDNDDLKEFILRWKQIAAIDDTQALDLATAAIRYYRGTDGARSELRRFQKLEEHWYKSLANGSPDFSVYDDQYILSDLWACWVVYSRKYLLSINSPKALGGCSIVDDMVGISSIIDLGCGISYTTAALKELFPHADVTGTNLEGTTQWWFGSALGRERGFNLNSQVTGHSDLIFASEYFEHFEQPLDHLEHILNICQPTYLLIANSFDSCSIGHFNTYRVGGEQVKPKRVSRAFNKLLRDSGYINWNTNLWNKRPAYWKRA